MLQHFIKNYQLGSLDWMRHREAIFAARKKHIKDVCEKYDDPRRWIAKSHKGIQFWIDRKHGLAACIHGKVNKVASKLITVIWWI